MRITSVHARTLPADVGRIGELVADLASERDVLWPSDKWPTLALRFDRPLGVGAEGGHGRIRYRVSAFEPGRRLEFTFAPGSGLEGTHEFRIRPAGEGGSVLEHRLDARLGPRMMPVAPILRGFHDAVLEDVLDRAELATAGRVERPAHWPRWVKLANAVDVRLSRLLARRGRPDGAARVAGVAIPVTLAALAALHAGWAAGSAWPARSRTALAEVVLSSSEGMPPDWATWAVAGLLLGGAAVVRRTAGSSPSTRMRLLTLGLTGTFLARAVAYLPSDLAGGLETTYQRLDLTAYAPLCLLIGLGAAAVARRHGPLDGGHR